MSAKDFLADVVRPNVAEFEQNPSSIRHAYNAAMAVDCLAAQLFHDLKGRGLTTANDDSAYRQNLARTSSDFGILRDIAKAMKHVVLDRYNPTVSTASQVEVLSLGWDEGGWDEARWDGPPQVHVTLDGGDIRPVDFLVRNAVAVIEQEMRTNGLF